jgi:hypothetical protein
MRCDNLRKMREEREENKDKKEKETKRKKRGREVSCELWPSRVSAVVERTTHDPKLRGFDSRSRKSLELIDVETCESMFQDITLKIK